MARGGLSNDPVKRERQLAALRKGNDRARAKIDGLALPATAEPTAEPIAEPASAVEPGKGRVQVGKVELPKPGSRPAKPKPASQAKKPPKPGKPAIEEPADEESTTAEKPAGWRPPRGALSLPFGGDE